MKYGISNTVFKYGILEDVMIMAHDQIHFKSADLYIESYNMTALKSNVKNLFVVK